MIIAIGFKNENMPGWLYFLYFMVGSILCGGSHYNDDIGLKKCWWKFKMSILSENKREETCFDYLEE